MSVVCGLQQLHFLPLTATITVGTLGLYNYNCTSVLVLNTSNTLMVFKLPIVVWHSPLEKLKVLLTLVAMIIMKGWLHPQVYYIFIPLY